MVWADCHRWGLRGISLRLSSMIARRTGPMSRSVPLGSQRRSRPLVCSLVGLYHGEWGSQKYALMPRASSMWAHRVISVPWMLLFVSSGGLVEVLLVALG